MTELRSSIIGLFLLAPVLSSITTFAQGIEENQTSIAQVNDESDVKAAVEAFLLALGNNELEKVKTMFLKNANIGSIVKSNDDSKTFTVSADQYISQLEEKQNKKFQEPVTQFFVNISHGMLAFVRADATVYYEGKASHHTNDFFILMKDNGIWKILSASYTAQPLVNGD